MVTARMFRKNKGWLYLGKKQPVCHLTPLPGQTQTSHLSTFKSVSNVMCHHQGTKEAKTQRWGTASRYSWKRGSPISGFQTLAPADSHYSWRE